jgi:DNA invertase Pin-like site-specific DNA recombinase
VILDRHIDSLDIPNAEVLEYCDNGHTGTNMERPAVQEMLELVRSGRVRCVAVKDFSRFSRNSMDSGYFIEQVFPLYGVRFISVSDNFDSDDYKGDTGGLDVAFKFLMHEYYSQDLSKKIKSAKHIQMKRGENIVARAIFGYRKENGRWVPDEPAAKIVREIFDLALRGKNTAGIRDAMTANGYPTPSRYLAKLHNNKITQSDTWDVRMVLTIIQNIQYTGTYVSGKQESRVVGSHSKDRTPKEAWIQIPGKHEPIVGKEDFEKANAMIKRVAGSTTAKPAYNVLLEDESSKKRSRLISGEHRPINVIYGYVKTGGGAGLELDPDAASVVREMFTFAEQGVTINEISEKLTQSGYLTPQEHIKRGKGKAFSESCAWTGGSVRNILRNVQYTGAYVAGKILKNLETGKKYHVPKCDWVIIPGRFPAIITREQFERVRATITETGNANRGKATGNYLLRGGILKCGCCGYALAYDPQRKSPVFRCDHTQGNPKAECHKMKVSAEQLDNAVLSIIRKTAEVVLNTADSAKLRKVGSQSRRVLECENEINLCSEERRRIYERFLLRKIDRETYLSLKSECSAKIDRLNNQIAVIRQSERDKEASRKTAELAQTMLDGAITPRELVETLIDKVRVFPGNRIEIQWKIADFAAAQK